MNANLLSLSVTKEQKTDKWGDLYILKMTVNDSLMGEVKLPSIYMRENEYKMLISCAKGESSIYPFFDDLSYLLKVYPTGARLIALNQYSSHIKNKGGHKESGNYCEYYIEFPFSDVTSWFESVLSTYNYNEYILDQDTIEFLSAKYAPRHTINFACKATPNDVTFEACIASLERMADNNSNGDIITISIYDDGMQDDMPRFYFDMRRSDHSRILIGGIVYWDNFGYQIHT